MDIISIITSMIFLILHVTDTDSFPKPLSAKEEKEAIDRMVRGDESAKKKLIEHNLRLVAHIVKKYYSQHSEQEDLISIGTIGLIKGINTFKPEKGARLATYCARCIDNEILMHFRSGKKSALEISFDEPIETDNEGNPLTLMDIIATDDTIIDDIDTKNKIKKIANIIKNMPESRDKEILIYRYGLNGKKPLTQREISEKMKISRSYVSRIEKRVLEEIKNKL